MKNISVVGTGYVGLVTGTCLAETGNRVRCIDIDKEKVSKLQSGIVPIYEPGLDTYFERNMEEGRLTFHNNLEEGLEDVEIVLLALPTPPNADGSADLSYILRAASDIAPLLSGYTIIVTKSTVPVGTADLVYEEFSRHLSEEEFDVVSNPEFLREGAAVVDFMKPERIIIGVNSLRARKVMEELYAPFVRQGNPVIFMDFRSAELSKYAANAFLATKISFMNEIANLCEKVKANVDEVRIGLGTDSRIGKRFLFPGVGFGGSCFPKDVRAIVKTASEHSYDFKILKSVIQINVEQQKVLANKILSYFGNDLSGKKLAVWGLAFKPNTDDIREASSIVTIQILLDHGAKIHAYDPEAMPNMKEIYPDQITYCQNQYESLDQCDALAILTEWNVFRNPDYAKMKSKMRQSVIFDGRNVFSLENMVKYGFQYFSIGRPDVL